MQKGEPKIEYGYDSFHMYNGSILWLDYFHTRHETRSDKAEGIHWYATTKVK